jgi:2-oxoglutarate dehydrogenase E2 component (dihydrolipoamide succinyltransferase)
MNIEIKVPVLPESVTDASIVKWHVKPGDFVKRDQTLVDLETDKVVLEVPAESDGYIENILLLEGAEVKEGEVLGHLKPGEMQVSGAQAPLQEAAKEETTESEGSGVLARLFSGPATRRAAKAAQVDLEKVQGTGRDGRITPQDVERHTSSAQQGTVMTQVAADKLSSQPIERVPMSRLRAKIAERLLTAQHQAAILTTFNEVNLQAIMELRARYKEVFEKKHGVRLGFMSFFTKAAVEALKHFPGVNASIEGNDIIYHHYYDIGIAVSTERGLVVPIIRNADQLNFSAIEKAVNDYGTRARKADISINELTGGTFTITNGGVFGSLLSTPILNPPQSAILGMHKIEERPVVENGSIVIRPMMYLALSYDHRIIDGKESVQFLAMIKNLLEDPARFLLDI